MLVHRPRYGDWTIPKGKADTGETSEETAVREVVEETGLTCRIVAPAGVNRYRVSAGMKRVEYFVMRPYRATPFRPNEEVDKIRWLTPEKAAATLSHAYDRRLAKSLDVAAATKHTHLHLVRHAAAGDRSKWKRPDEERPLTSKGRSQAKALAGELADVGIGRILSSPYVRCMETVEPLAKVLGLKVESHPALAEDPKPQNVADLVDSVAGTDTLVCTHGDVMPIVMDRVKKSGIRFPSKPKYRKGSTWTVAYDSGRPVSATYFPPP